MALRDGWERIVMKRFVSFCLALIMLLGLGAVSAEEQGSGSLKGALGAQLLEKSGLPAADPDSAPYLALFVEYEKTEQYCTTHAKATLRYVNSNGKIDNPAAQNVTIELKTEDTLELLDGSSYQVFYNDLACGSEYTFEFDLFCEFPMEAVEKAPEPKLTITVKSANAGGCEYTCTFDSMTEPRAFVWGWETSDMAPEAIQNDIAMMEILFEKSYYNKQHFDVSSFYNHEDIWELMSQLKSLETDDNDVTYIYINAHGPRIGDYFFPGFEAYAPDTYVIFRDKKYENKNLVLFKEFFGYLQQNLRGRIVVVFDVCQSGAAIERAEDMGFEEGQLSLITSVNEDSAAGAWDDYGWFTKEVYKEFVDKPGVQTAGDVYGAMRHHADTTVQLGAFATINPQFTGNSDTVMFCFDENEWIEDPEFVVAKETLTVGQSASVVVTTENYSETSQHFKSTIIRPRVYASANPQLTALIDAEMDKLFVEKLASMESRKASAASCKYNTRDHTETLKLTAAYATGGFVTLTLQNGYFDCAVGHNVSETLVYCFDVATGRQITMEDMLDVQNNPSAKEDLLALMGEKLREEGASASDAQKVYSEAVQNRYVYWDITPKGFSFSIDRMNTGIRCGGFTVYFDQMKGVLKAEYLPTQASGQAGFAVSTADPGQAALVYENTPAVNALELSGTAEHVWITNSHGTNSLDGRCAHFYAYRPDSAMITLAEPTLPEYGYAVGWIDAEGEHMEHLLAQ